MLCTSRFSHPPSWIVSRGTLTSGPLNTDGSFMSFQMNKFGAESYIESV